MKVTVRQNVWGNWYGYIGGRLAAMFFGNDHEQSADAARWLKAVSALTPAQQRAAVGQYRFGGRTYGHGYTFEGDTLNVRASWSER